MFSSSSNEPHNLIVGLVFLLNIGAWIYVFFVQLKKYLSHQENSKPMGLKISALLKELKFVDGGKSLTDEIASPAEESHAVSMQETKTPIISFQSRLPQIVRPDFFEGKTYIENKLELSIFSDTEGFKIVHPSDAYRLNPIKYLDDLIVSLLPKHNTLILADLDRNKFGYYKPNIETFYDGVDVMTNFSRSNFIMKEDVLGLVNELKSKYGHIILLTEPDSVWSFKIIQNDAALVNETVE